MARGEETAHSDVDLLLIGEIGFAEVVRALHSVQDLLQREINPVVYGAEEFRQKLAGGDRFGNEILSTPKLFVTGSADDLGNLAGDTQAASLRA